MIAMQEHKNFWDKNAGRYDRFMRKDRAAYGEMIAEAKRDNQSAKLHFSVQDMFCLTYAECEKTEV